MLFRSGDLHLGGERRLRQVGQGRQHLAGLVGVVVDRLLAQDHEPGLLLVHDGLDRRLGQCQLGHLV